MHDAPDGRRGPLILRCYRLVYNIPCLRPPPGPADRRRCWRSTRVGVISMSRETTYVGRYALGVWWPIPLAGRWLGIRTRCRPNVSSARRQASTFLTPSPRPFMHLMRANSRPSSSVYASKPVLWPMTTPAATSSRARRRGERVLCTERYTGMAGIWG
ncbi:hypothetical protein BDZ97DRAFT_1193443 [Flammula alnicola]|nr:hypothetical protein BDZ97DRAFT_1193443 [Flammula alnicola]